MAWIHGLAGCGDGPKNCSYNLYPQYMQSTGNIIRQGVHVNGLVQGVGFRPFVYRLAQLRHLTGFVANSFSGVDIEVEGSQVSIDYFLHDLRHTSPPLAVINEITVRPLQARAEKSFQIHISDSHGCAATQIAPDVALCPDCLRELGDPADRRYQYPFINCTNCGPRYTIIEGIPYDRASTSMGKFSMCDTCQAEYNDPGGRRFHAQPNCCVVCGPEVRLYAGEKSIVSSGQEAIVTAVNLLKEGSVLAIKGLGGFHLAVDAENDVAVAKLRLRKAREEKPFAVMVADLHTAKMAGRFNSVEERALQSPQSPILLACKREGHFLSHLVAPGNDMFGLMLPYTPLHYLLFTSGLRALVMTSANYRDEPLCIDNHEVFKRLSSVVDFFLLHDRDIYLRNDDSIVQYMGDELHQVRRSRGFVPHPLAVLGSGPPVLAVGGELKNTLCLLKDRQAIPSQHIGDLKNIAAYSSFCKTIDHLLDIFDVTPELIVHDLQPQYLSTRWALEQKNIKTLAVQHHHAHLASCLAENKFEGPAIGVILDGSGYGSDNTIWGGEILIGNCCSFKRFGSLEPMPLPGGDAAIRSPWRIAVAYLAVAFDRLIPDLSFLAEHTIQPVLEMVDKNINTPYSSSCGRLFDAVAALCGGRQNINYEAQAAIEFMQASQGQYGKSYPYEIIAMEYGVQLSVQAIVKSVVANLQAGDSFAEISRRFHQTLIEMYTETCGLARKESGIKTVALSGGVFQNRLLFEGLLAMLNKSGFKVLVHRHVPTNDGGIALGQAMIGRQYLVNKIDDGI